MDSSVKENAKPLIEFNAIQRLGRVRLVSSLVGRLSHR